VSVKLFASGQNAGEHIRILVQEKALGEDV